MELTTNIYTANGVTMCVIDALIDGEWRTFTGAATLHPDDRNRPNIGRQLAEARAFRNLANRLERRANGLVKHNDDIAAHVATPAPQWREKGLNLAHLWAKGGAAPMQSSSAS